MVNFEVKSTFLFPLDQAIPRGFLLCELHHLRRSSSFSDHSFFHPLALFLNHSSKASAMELSECCALYFYFYFLLYFFLLIYFTLNVFFSLRCAHVQKLFFFLFFFTIFCGHTPEFFSPLFFSFIFCKLCTIFRSTLFINLLSTHIHCCNCAVVAHVHTKSKAHSLPFTEAAKLNSKVAILLRDFGPI